MPELRYLRNVATVKLDDRLCDGCRMCLTVCPHAVFAVDDRRARIVEKDACMECGACARNCPTGAISVAAGVGCVAAIIIGALTGSEPNCGCDGPACCE